MKAVSKFHKFWETKKNPITMKVDDIKLHIHNISKEQKVDLEYRRSNNESRRQISSEIFDEQVKIDKLC